jgi:hypothetical protein
MENFNAQFKSKDVKGLAWKIAKATTNQDFDNAVTELNAAKPEAMLWLTNIGLEKSRFCVVQFVVISQLHQTT